MPPTRRQVHIQAEFQREREQRAAAGLLLETWLAAGLDTANVFFSQCKGHTKCKIEIHGTPAEVFAFLQPSIKAHTRT